MNAHKCSADVGGFFELIEFIWARSGLLAVSPKLWKRARREAGAD